MVPQVSMGQRDLPQWMVLSKFRALHTHPINFGHLVFWNQEEQVQFVIVSVTRKPGLFPNDQRFFKSLWSPLPSLNTPSPVSVTSGFRLLGLCPKTLQSTTMSFSSARYLWPQPYSTEFQESPLPFYSFIASNFGVWSESSIDRKQEKGSVWHRHSKLQQVEGREGARAHSSWACQTKKRTWSGKSGHQDFQKGQAHPRKESGPGKWRVGSMLD